MEQFILSPVPVNTRLLQARHIIDRFSERKVRSVEQGSIKYREYRVHVGDVSEFSTEPLQRI